MALALDAAARSDFNSVLLNFQETEAKAKLDQPPLKCDYEAELAKATRNHRIQRGVSIALICLAVISLASIALYAIVPAVTLGIAFGITVMVVSIVSGGVIFPLHRIYGVEAARKRIDDLFSKLLAENKCSLTPNKMTILKKYGAHCQSLDVSSYHEDITLGVTLKTYLRHESSVTCPNSKINPHQTWTNFPNRKMTPKETESLNNIITIFRAQIHDSEMLQLHLDYETLIEVRKCLYGYVLEPKDKDSWMYHLKNHLTRNHNRVWTINELFKVISYCPNLKKIVPRLIDDRWFKPANNLDKVDRALQEAIEGRVIEPSFKPLQGRKITVTPHEKRDATYDMWQKDFHGLLFGSAMGI